MGDFNMTQWVNFKTVREHLSFRDVLAHYGIEEKGSGDQIKIVCPFHNDHKPSCGVNHEKQLYNCFVCDAGGNALDFVTNMEGLDPNKTGELRKAALFAANTFGIEAALQKPSNGRATAKSKTARSDKPVKAKAKPVKSETPDKASKDKPDKPSNQPLTFTLDVNHKHPFIEARGYKPKLIKKFGIGFSNRGSMKGRIAFPIHNTDGEVIAYSGRWASDELPEDTPRYLLPKGFEKSKVLYNLHRFIKKQTKNPALDTAVIVEGFWSVLRLHTENIPSVSTFGDSISEAQAELLVRHGFKNAILIFS
jgi:DNA primase